MTGRFRALAGWPSRAGRLRALRDCPFYGQPWGGEIGCAIACVAPFRERERGWLGRGPTLNNIYRP